MEQCFFVCGKMVIRTNLSLNQHHVDSVTVSATQIATLRVFFLCRITQFA